MSDKVNQIINHVKELIQDSNITAQNCIKNINNQIDSKENEIRQMFSQSIESVIDYHIQFHHTLSSHKKIQQSCEQFNKNIQKIQKLNAYDQNQIQRYENDLKQIKNIKQKLYEYKNYLQLARKASLNINQQKYSIAIKIINQFKSNPPKTKSPLSNIIPILQNKVQEHLKGLLNGFWSENSNKMYQIGRNCFNKIQSNFQQKLNIYKIFFGDNFRNSTLNNHSSFRYTVLAKQNQNKLFHESNDCQQYLNKVMIRINVEMSIIKKVKLMQTQLKSQGLFNDMLTQSMKDYLSIIQQFRCEKHEDIVKSLSYLVGFLLIKRQVCAFFDIKNQEKVFMNHVYEMISHEIKELVDNIKFTKIIIDIEQSFSAFQRLLILMKLNEDKERYNNVIIQLLDHYNNRNMQNYELQAAQQIQKDNLAHYVTNDSQKQSLIRQVFDMPSSQSFKFTGYVIFIMDYFLKSYQDALDLIQQSDINQSAIFLSINELYQKILYVNKKHLLSKKNHFELIQGQLNMIYVDKVYKFIVRQMEIFHGISSNTIRLQQIYQKLMVQFTANVLQVIRQKISVLMQGYDNNQQMNHMNQKNNDFIEWTFSFIFQLTQFMKNINFPKQDSILLEMIREVGEVYWQYLRRTKQINLIIIYNLDQDLLYIYKFCAQNFKDHVILVQKFKALREFYSLMLINNINDLLQPQKRAISYANLNMQTVINLLRKYNQVKIPNNKIRDIRKKDVQNLIKKYQQNTK